MKHLPALLGVVAVLMAPLSTQASPQPVKHDTVVVQAKAPARRSVAAAPDAQKPRCVYRITRFTAVGSHIPVVVSRYDGLRYSLNGIQEGRVYGTPRGLTGSTSVRDALQGDPAISSR